VLQQSFSQRSAVRGRPVAGAHARLGLRTTIEINRTTAAGGPSLFNPAPGRLFVEVALAADRQLPQRRFSGPDGSSRRSMPASTAFPGRSRRRRQGDGRPCIPAKTGSTAYQTSARGPLRWCGVEQVCRSYWPGSFVDQTEESVAAANPRHHGKGGCAQQITSAPRRGRNGSRSSLGSSTIAQ